MVKTPQRGRRYEGAVRRLNIDVDIELLYSVKRLALDERTTVTRWVERALREAVGGSRTTGARTRAGSGAPRSRLSMNIDPGLHAEAKRKAIEADLPVTRYVELVLDGATR